MPTREKPFQYMISEAMKPEDPMKQQELSIDFNGSRIELGTVTGKEVAVTAFKRMAAPHLTSLNRLMKDLGIQGRIEITIEEK